MVRDAPTDVQTLTDTFLATVDRLKRQYITNMVRTKVLERKHSATEDYVGSVVDEYHTMVRKDSYLDQVGRISCSFGDTQKFIPERNSEIKTRAPSCFRDSQF